MAAVSAIVASRAMKKLLFPQLHASTSLSTTACFSTAYERSEGSNAVKEAREGGDGGGTLELPYTPKESVKEGLYETKHQGMRVTKDPARDGPVKAAEKADTVGDTAKETLDGQWKAAQETKRKIVDEAVRGRNSSTSEDEGPNRNDDTSSSDEDPNVKDLRRRAEGYDKKDDDF